MSKLNNKCAAESRLLMMRGDRWPVDAALRRPWRWGTCYVMQQQQEGSLERELLNFQDTERPNYLAVHTHTT